MATAVVMPKQGNSVESCLIVDWKKNVGDAVKEGDILCEVETDKAVMEVESAHAGTLLARFFDEGEEVPVMVNIAAIGEPGEDVSDLDPNAGQSAPAPAAETSTPAPADAPDHTPDSEPPIFTPQSSSFISPRARHLAERKALDPTPLTGTGPGGRIIERDVEAALAAQPKLSPVAKAMVEEGGYVAPERGSGPGGRIMARDLVASGEWQVTSGETEEATRATSHEDVEIIPVKGVRKVIAQRMLASLQTTAQLTLDGSADARAMLALRTRLKASADALGLQGITINDLILFAVSRTLLRHPELNAHFDGEAEIRRYASVHLGMAVDTPRGLMVPVIHNADRYSVKALSQEAKRLATACLESRVKPDELAGGTFTVTNLGALGVEHFTPVLNPPEVAILGVGNVNLKPVAGTGGEVEFIPHLGLSLTINHQVVDGAPGARFLQDLARGIAEIDLLLAD
jgi:pyruvate dehydrogenase E2 component (dihydrolipoamide acetyltransferase)